MLKNSYYQKFLSKMGVAGNAIPVYGWSGDYPSWQEARAEAGGYEQTNILEKTLYALLQVRSGAAVYERDSVLFSQKQYPFPLIATLLHIASANNNVLHVIDFGGSLGSTWYQVRDFLAHVSDVKWHVVEQKGYVDAGRIHFQDDTLAFYYSFEEAFAAGRPHVVLLSSVVQYLEDPHQFLSELALASPEYIVFDRTSIIDQGGDRLTVQRVPPSIYDASYPSWFFNQEKFLAHFAEYDCLAEFPSYVESERVLCIDGKPAAKDKGFFLKRKV